jgi:TPR repeat protein
MRRESKKTAVHEKIACRMPARQCKMGRRLSVVALAALLAPVASSARAVSDGTPQLRESVVHFAADRDFAVRSPAPRAAALILVANDARFTVEDMHGPPGKPLPVRITLPPENDDLFRVVMFRGVPEKVEFTGGFSLGEAWAVSPEDLDGLALVAPDNYSGRFELEVIYIHGKGETRERRTISVSIGDTPAPARAAISPQVEETMFAKSERLLATGDVAAARLVFDFLARQDSARGAFALAQTYDPEFLDSLNVRGGVRPNMAKAMKWYREAARLGSEQASTRLSALRAGQ